ncbi:MAG: GNAT family N-acetyltransferase [Lachnospiraceae bacterium]|nr:GNAT family N-acetyltransferase [Lachnospiraceae bacterium]
MINQGTKTLETKRLILRRYTIEDAEQMYLNWASDPAVTHFLTWPTHKSIDVTKRVVNDWVSHYRELNYYNWGIELKENGALIGNIAVVGLEEEIDAAEIGYCLGKAWWGQEIMPEALDRVIDFLFDEAGANRVCAHHDENNPKSGRVMEKAGMKQEGIMRAAAKNNQGICNKVCWAVLKSDRK